LPISSCDGPSLLLKQTVYASLKESRKSGPLEKTKRLDLLPRNKVIVAGLGSLHHRLTERCENRGHVVDLAAKMGKIPRGAGYRDNETS